MNSTKPIDSKREEYRKYLERTGVMDAITKILSSLYEVPEKPSDALGFLYKSLGEDRPENFEYAETQKELEQQKAKVDILQNELKCASEKIESLEKLLAESKAEKGEAQTEDVVVEEPVESAVTPSQDPSPEDAVAEEAPKEVVTS